MPSDLPGYYWNESRRKYFKIVEDHAATASSSYSKAAVAEEEQKKKDRKKLEEFSNRVQESRVPRNTLLQGHPLGGNLALQRELGSHEGHIASATAAIWAKGLDPKPFIERLGPSGPEEPYRQIRHFIRDPGTYAIAYTMNWSEYTGHANAPSVVVMLPNPARAVNDVDRYFLDPGKSLGLMPLSELLEHIADTLRSVGSPSDDTLFFGFSLTTRFRATGIGGKNCAPSIHMVRLVEPSSYFNGVNAMYRHRQERNWHPGSASLPAIDQDMACLIQLQKTNTIWCSAAGPHANQPIFAVGTSDGVKLVGLRNESLEILVQHLDWPRDDQGRDTLAVEFWTETTVLAGMRSGKVRLWDIRANGANVRFQHMGTVRHVRAIDEHKVLVAGLKDKLSLYDARFIKVSPQSEQSSTFAPSEPLYTFPTYRMKASTYPKLGFDVYRDLVASGTEDMKVQIFDLTSGKELDVGHKHNLPNGTLTHPAMCLKFVEHDHNGDGLRLLVANGRKIDAWAW
ncbi:MAG: hypothetical protein Q9211_005475 [Gyalolechia sp. 1 TL-2023]